MEKLNRINPSNKVYTARLGWHMLRVIMRKLYYGLRQSIAIISGALGVYVWGIPNQPIEKYNKNVLDVFFDEALDPSNDDPQMPNSLREYMQLLAEELETAEVDFENL